MDSWDLSDPENEPHVVVKELAVSFSEAQMAYLTADVDVFKEDEQKPHGLAPYSDMLGRLRRLTEMNADLAE